VTGGGQPPIFAAQNKSTAGEAYSMQKRQLGPGGPAVSAVGIGAMSFTNFYGPTSEEASHAILTAALDLGIDHLDTSNVYGMGLSERVIGSFLARQGKVKDGLFRIATKAGIRRDKETGKRGFDNTPAYLEAELDASLQRLGVEAVDLFYVHRRDQSIPIEEVAGTLAGFITAGKIHAFGFSEIAPSSLRRAALEHPVAAVQSEYSLQTRAPELGLVQSCERLGASLVARRRRLRRSPVPTSTRQTRASPCRTTPPTWRSPRASAGWRRRWAAVRRRSPSPGCCTVAPRSLPFPAPARSITWSSSPPAVHCG